MLPLQGRQQQDFLLLARLLYVNVKLTQAEYQAIRLLAALEGKHSSMRRVAKRLMDDGGLVKLVKRYEDGDLGPFLDGDHDSDSLDAAAPMNMMEHRQPAERRSR